MAFSKKMKAPPFGGPAKSESEAPMEGDESSESDEDDFDSLFGDEVAEDEADVGSIPLADATTEQLQAELDKRMEEESDEDVEEEDDDMEESDSDFLI